MITNLKNLSLYVFYFLDMFSVTGYLSIFMLYISSPKNLGGLNNFNFTNLDNVGTFLFFTKIIEFTIILIFGWFIHKFKDKTNFIFSAILRILSFLLFCCSDYRAYALGTIFLCFSGITFRSAAYSYANENIRNPNECANYYSNVNIAYTIGSNLGLFFIPTLARFFGYRFCFLFISLISLITIFMVFFIPQTNKSKIIEKEISTKLFMSSIFFSFVSQIILNIYIFLSPLLIFMIKKPFNLEFLHFGHFETIAYIAALLSFKKLEKILNNLHKKGYFSRFQCLWLIYVSCIFSMIFMFLLQILKNFNGNYNIFLSIFILYICIMNSSIIYLNRQLYASQVLNRKYISFMNLINVAITSVFEGIYAKTNFYCASKNNLFYFAIPVFIGIFIVWIIHYLINDYIEEQFKKNS